MVREATVFESGRECVATVTGYLDQEGGKQLAALIEVELAKGFLAFILDLSNCPLVNSLGVAALIQVAIRIKQDFAGRLLANRRRNVFFSAANACVSSTARTGRRSHSASLTSTSSVHSRTKAR